MFVQDLISGHGVKGVKTKGNFDNKLDATTEFIYEILETTPLEIVIEAVPEFCEVRMMVSKKKETTYFVSKEK